MGSKENWSFKFLLAGDQERSDGPFDKVWMRANMSVPFLANKTLSHIKQTDRIYSLGMEDSASVKNQPQPNQIEDATLLDNIDELSISELRRLRRTIALKLHPDRNRGEQTMFLKYEMSDVNLLIDNAIKKKSDLAV